MAIFERIKFDGLRSRDWLIYKYPGESFATGSQLIVNEGQVAIFIKGGEICDIFEAGSYTLNTDNLPVIQQIFNIPFGGKTPFTAEIYYLNTKTKLDMNWGTTDAIQLIDPKYFVRLHIRAFGQFSVKLIDYKRFFTELVGTMGSYEIIHFDKIQDYFKGILVSKVKTIIADIIINNKISALEIAPHLEDISDHAFAELQDSFENYGVAINSFKIQSINFPNEDFEQINKFLQNRAEFEIIGDQRYATKRSFDVYEGAATTTNGAAGSILASSIGLSAGMQAGQQMQSVVSSPQENIQSETCPKCHAKQPVGSKFCSQCGSPMTVPQQEGIACQKCGTMNPEGSKFCLECGFSLGPIICECGAKLQPGTKFCSQCGKKL